MARRRLYPFHIVVHIPPGVSEETLRGLRDDIIEKVHRCVGAQNSLVQVSFAKDVLEPTNEDEYVVFTYVHTTLFHSHGGLSADYYVAAKNIASSVGQAVFSAFNGNYGVWTFIVDLDPAWDHPLYSWKSRQQQALAHQAALPISPPC